MNIKTTKKYIKELIATLERTLILIEDNKSIEDISGFYNGELVLYELNDHLKELREVLK